MSRVNNINIDQLNLVCSHVEAQIDALISPNFAMRPLILMADVYAKLRIIGNANPDRADQFEKWSNEAVNLWKQKLKETPKPSFGSYLRCEHGFGKTKFAEIVLATFKKNGKLTETTMDNLVDKYWRVAVITLKEDKKLDRTNKAEKFAEERWDSAGIKFYDGKSPYYKQKNSKKYGRNKSLYSENQPSDFAEVFVSHKSNAKLERDYYEKIKKLYEKFRKDYYSGRFDSLREGLKKIKIEEGCPHSMDRFVVFYTKPKFMPKVMLIGNNPSFFHDNFTEKCPTDNQITLAEKNLNDVAERIPSVNSYLDHGHKFGKDLNIIFEGVGDGNWLIEAVGLNSFFLQTGGKGIKRLREISNIEEFEEMEKLCVQITKETISILKPRLVIFIGSEAKKRFPERDFPRIFHKENISYMDVMSPSNRRGGWSKTLEDIKNWFKRFPEAYDHIN